MAQDSAPITELVKAPLVTPYQSQHGGWKDEVNQTPALLETEADKLDYAPDPNWKPVHHLEEPWDWDYTLGPKGKWVKGTTSSSRRGGWNYFLSKQAIARAQAHKKWVTVQRLHRVDKAAWVRAEKEGKFPEPSWAVRLRILAYSMPTYRPPQDSVEYYLFNGLSMHEAFRITCDELSKIPDDLYSMSQVCYGTQSAVLVSIILLICKSDANCTYTLSRLILIILICVCNGWWKSGRALVALGA